MSYRMYSVVNIVGLALSLACTIVIARYLYAEYTVDNGHRNVDRICATVEQSSSGTDNRLSGIDGRNPHPMLLDPQVEAYCLTALENPAVKIDRTDYTPRVMRVDSTFQSVFDFPVTAGNPKICQSRDQAAISARYAATVFGDKDPVGQTIDINGKSLTITSVVGDIASKSSIYFDILTHIDYLGVRDRRPMGWVLLAAGHTAGEINAKYPSFSEVYGGNTTSRFQLLSIGECYFRGWMDSGEQMAHGDRRSLSVLMMVALLVLTIGVFNFVNIYTVLMLRRSRETSIKKVFGASTVEIIRGVYLENLLMVAVAILLGWLLVGLFKGMIEGRLGITMGDNFSFDVALSVAVVVALPALTSIYPYFKHRYARPITSLRAVGGGGGGKSIGARAVLLVGQYVVTVVMVVVALFFVRQLGYMLSSDLGYRSHGVIKVRMFQPIPANVQGEEYQKRKEQHVLRYRMVADRMNASSLFLQWQYAKSPNTISGGVTHGFSVAGGDYLKVAYLDCSEAYADMFDLKVTRGRWLSDTTESWNSYAMVVNEAFLRAFDIKDYSTASVQPETRLWYSFNGTDDDKMMALNPPYTIVGVVADFQIGHLREAVPPLIIVSNAGGSNAAVGESMWTPLCATTTKGREHEAVEFMRSLHEKVGDGEFKYSMIDDEIAATYAEDRRVTIIYSTFALIAILIGCLGLFSLSLYDVQQRYREIALRRVNGAKVGQIVGMLLRKYYILLGIAFVVAIPISWLAIDWYTQDFAHKAPLSWWIFVVAAALTASVSLLTMIFQTVKAARTNPAVAMKRE